MKKVSKECISLLNAIDFVWVIGSSGTIHGLKRAAAAAAAAPRLAPSGSWFNMFEQLAA